MRWKLKYSAFLVKNILKQCTFIHFIVVVLLFVSNLRPTRYAYLILCLKLLLHLLIIFMCIDQYFWRICLCIIFWKRNSYWQYWYVKILP